MDQQPERWTRATVYPDMWPDPNNDPRENQGPSPDGEFETHQDYLRNYRITVRMNCDGLTPQQLATRSVPPSTMSLLGLIRHLAEDERDWRNWTSEDAPLPKIYGPRDADFDSALGEQSDVEAAFATLAREQTGTDAAMASHSDLGARLGKDQISVRGFHVPRIEEYVRHAGHADLLRECIDGRVGQ